MAKPTDVCVRGVALHLLPVQTRVPLKFGPETLTAVTCARVRVRIADARGRTATGWGETPLSVQWVWPSRLPYESRHRALVDFSRLLAEAWARFESAGHPLELGLGFQESQLRPLLEAFNQGATRCLASPEPMPWLAALVCCSAFDLALHDAFGCLLDRPVYTTYGPEFLSRDLAAFLEPAPGAAVDFAGRFPADYLEPKPRAALRAWHLVGGLDPLERSDLTGSEPDDGYPVLLGDWIRTDGLECLKVKLRGNDAAWDYDRLVRVGRIGLAGGVEWLSADYNCTVTDPDYVNAMLDRLRDAEPRLYGMLLYVEQPFPYELEQHRIDVRSVAGRKPLFLDESAHEWRLVRLGRDLGWSGVALKTCKTQSGALLSACWARAHGMSLMVQDLSNPMLAQIPHVLLAAHVGTIMGVETNSMQFYPAASLPEAAVHPGLYRRRTGRLDLTSLAGPGFGYRLDDIRRPLPPADTECGE
jgi:L-alanine-DL-glutamate epimerase-like enolase superfamily enzyme